MRHVHGPHVYDDQSDQWYRFDNEDEAVNFAAQGETMRYVPTVREAVSTHESSGYLLITSNDPVMIAADDKSRTRIQVFAWDVAGSSDVFAFVIGSRAEVTSGNGFVLLSTKYEGNPYIELKHTDEIWVKVVPDYDGEYQFTDASVAVTWVIETKVS